MLHFVAIIGAAQGALLLALVALRFRRAQNLPLALLLLAYSLRMGTIPTWNPETMVALRWLLPVTTPLPFLFGPLLWWFAHELSDDSGVRTSPWIALHFLPFVLDVLFTAALAIGMSDREYGTMVAAIFAGRPPLHLLLRNGAKVVVNVTYVALAVRLAFRRRPIAESTPHQRIWLRWLVCTPIVSLLLFAFVALVPNASLRLAEGQATPFLLLSVAMAALIYVFSFLFLLAPEVPSGVGRRNTVNSRPEHQREYRKIADRVQTLLDQGAFRDPDLSRESMAEELGIRPEELSHAINREFGVSLPTLVGQKRVEFFLAGADRGELDRKTILELAFEAGFSSKSTFNRVFKAVTGRSPSQCCVDGKSPVR